ncbi:MAG: hypothetical protein R3F38_02135 [Gammaproteobacteria bacterium]
MWLWQDGHLLFWLAALLGASGVRLLPLAQRLEQRNEQPPDTQPNPHWPAQADSPWQAVDGIASSVQH